MLFASSNILNGLIQWNSYILLLTLLTFYKLRFILDVHSQHVDWTMNLAIHNLLACCHQLGSDKAMERKVSLIPFQKYDIAVREYYIFFVFLFKYRRKLRSLSVLSVIQKQFSSWIGILILNTENRWTGMLYSGKVFIVYQNKQVVPPHPASYKEIIK